MKIFLAGTNAEIENKEDILKSKYILESFYYIKPWQTEVIKKCEMFLLDSGAFTFMQNSKSHVDWDEYLKRYAEFINANNVQYFFELDIDSVVGHEKVKNLRYKLENLVNRPVIPVWHKSRGIDEFRRLCEQYKYVAIGGIVSKEIKNTEYKIFPQLIRIAHQSKTKIHGLGFTSTQSLKRYHFDSVDSTRWNCARFGRLEYFDGKGMRPIDRRKNGKRLNSKGYRKEIMKFTFNEWIKFQHYAENNL